MRRVARIGVTPVKSTALTHPREVELDELGAPEDRRFYLVDGDGRMFTADRFGPLQTIRASYQGERLSLTFPDGAVVEGDAGRIGEPVVTDFYGRPVRAHIVEGPWSAPLSAFTGTGVRLARCDVRGDGADVHHVTIMSSASVAELARRGGLTGALDGRRFRMTFELDGCGPHEEDGWADRRIRVGAVELHVLGPVPRCVITTHDPATGHKDFDTLKVLASYRELMHSDGRGIPFGVYAEVTRPGRVRVGDEVVPLGEDVPSAPAARRDGGKEEP